MFGSKLKTWMENYIGRAKKKDVQKEKHKANERGAVILESSESLAQSDTGISSSSQQVLSSTTTDNREGYSTTTIESERSGRTETHTAISLPSPESAYSTGYSTDGASPGATGPPEYYINIRTGKHYFPSPAPTPTSPQPKNDILHLQSVNLRLPDDSFLPSSLIGVSHVERKLSSSSSSSSCAKLRSQTTLRPSNAFPSEIDYFSREIQESAFRQNTLSPRAHDQSETPNYSKSPNKKSSAKSQLTSFKLFLKSPKKEEEKSKSEIVKSSTPIENKKNLTSTGKSKKWFKQPFHKLGHRRTDLPDERGPERDAKTETHFDKNFCYLLAQESSASPRQRNRIKTNPWLPTEPLSSQNFHNLNFSPMLARNRSCSNTPLQNRKTSQPDSLQNRILQLNAKLEESRDYKDGLEKSVNRHMAVNLMAESSDLSEEDLTLNEMMGTYNESYVYEKETDILSDSDPTDCEDYGTDSEANNGGDERDSHDDELDFIDNGSVMEDENRSTRNTGKCFYYDSHVKKNSFLLKGDRHHNGRGSEYRKNSKKDQDSKARREKRRQSRRCFQREDEEMRVKKTSEGKIVQKTEMSENVRGLSLRRILADKVVANKGSKSVEGTPVTVRKQRITKELRKSHMRNVMAERKKPENSEKLYLGDAEADIRYKELIEEAENIFKIIQNSPVVETRKNKSLFNNENFNSQRTDRNCVSNDVLKNARIVDPSPVQLKDHETPPSKNSRDLDLKFCAETPKKFKHLDFPTKKQSSFREKFSAHSPLDPLGPSLRNFAIFQPKVSEERKISRSSSEDSENGKGQERKWGVVPPIPMAFQSIDLGKPLTSYCPLSEPVKRKIYTCSKTFDKLVKRIENKPTIFEEHINGGVSRISFETNGHYWTEASGLNTSLNGNQGSLPGKNHRESIFEEEAFPCLPHVPGNRFHSKIPQNLPSIKPDIFNSNTLILQRKKE